MTVELTDMSCPECTSPLQVIYDSPRKQVRTGWACADCGFVASEKAEFREQVPLSEDEEYVLRIEKSLTTADVRDPRDDVIDEFRARATERMAADEVWMLVDPEDGSLVDILAGESDGEDEAGAG